MAAQSSENTSHTSVRPGKAKTAGGGGAGTYGKKIKSNTP